MILSAPYVLARAGVYGFLIFLVLAFGTWTTGVLNRISRRTGCTRTEISQERRTVRLGENFEVTQFLELFGYSASCIVTAALLLKTTFLPKTTRSLIMTVVSSSCFQPRGARPYVPWQLFRVLVSLCSSVRCVF